MKRQDVEQLYTVRRSDEVAEAEEFMCGVCGVEEEGADSGGSREVRGLPDPRRPCQKDVDLHNLTHLPFRKWCRHCMRGRGKEMAHQRQAPHTEMLHEFSLD